MTILDRIAPVLISSLFLLTPLTSFAEDSVNSGLDAGSEMFTDTVDIGGAFDEPTPPTKEYSGSSAQPAAPVHKMKLAKAKKAKKPHAAHKAKKTRSKAQKTKKKTHKAKTPSSDDAAGAHAAAAIPAAQPAAVATPVKAVSTSPAASPNAATTAPVVALQPDTLANKEGEGHYLGSLIGGLVLIALGGVGYFMRKKSQAVDYSLSSGSTNLGSEAPSHFASEANVFTQSATIQKKPAKTKVSAPDYSAPEESFVSNI